MTEMRKTRGTVLIVALLAILAGCGPMPESTPAPQGTAPPAATGTVGAGENGTEAAGTPAAGQLTLGDLAARIDAAWPSVRSYRVTFTGATVPFSGQMGTPVARATPGATPVARARETFQTVREVVLPDRQRQVVAGLGDSDHEAIAIGNRLFVRGPLVERIAPGTPPETWIEIDPSALPADSTLSHLLGGLPEMPGAPLATLPERLQPQTVREVDTVEFDGRECRVYAAADTVPATGMRVDYAIAIDERDRPCFIETSAGGEVQGRDEYTAIDAEITITAPTTATPVSVPPALATPVPHD